MFDASEFKSMEFNPAVKKKMLDVYPTLRDILGEADDKLIRYVILMYDKNSPLIGRYPDLQRRKEFAAQFAGYNLDDDLSEIFDFKREEIIESENKAGEIVKETVVYENEEMLMMIQQYLQYTNSRLWSLIVSNEQFFYECQRRVMVPVGDDRDKDLLTAVTTKIKLTEAMHDVNNRLTNYYAQLTGNDDKLEEAVTKMKRTRPEDYASVRRN